MSLHKFPFVDSRTSRSPAGPIVSVCGIVVTPKFLVCDDCSAGTVQMWSISCTIPLLAEQGWRDSLIEAVAPGAKREPDRAKAQLMVSSAKHPGRSDHPVCAFASLGASTPPLRGGEFWPLLSSLLRWSR